MEGHAVRASIEASAGASPGDRATLTATDPPSDGASSHGAGAARPGRRPVASPKTGQPSVVRHAISLVLNYPSSAEKADVEKLAGLQRRGADLLESLIETVHAEPNIATAGLLERFRHDEQGRHLGKLAASELPVDDDFDAGAELAECMEQLAQAGRKERIAFLIEKQRLDGLTVDEKAELQELLRAA